MQVFVRSDSTLCQEALKYAEKFAERREGICVEVVDTLADKASLDRFWQLVRQFRVEKPRVPLFVACGQLKAGFSTEEKSGAGIEELFAIHAYIRPTCQHCRDATRFLTGLAQRWRGIRLILHDVDREPNAFREMNALARKHGIAAPSFPVIYISGRVISGYQTDATTGRQIEELLVKASAPEVDKVQIAPQPRQSQTKLGHFLRPTKRETGLSVSYLRVTRLVKFAAENTDAPAEVVSKGPRTLESELPPVDEESPSEETYTAPVEAPEGIELPWIGYVRVSDLVACY
jgi:glutaredoxin